MTVFEEMARAMRVRSIIQLPDFDVPSIDTSALLRAMNEAGNIHSRKMRAISDALRQNYQKPVGVFSPGDPRNIPDELKKAVANGLAAAIKPPCTKHKYVVIDADESYYNYQCGNCGADAKVLKSVMNYITTYSPWYGRFLFADGNVFPTDRRD